MIQTKQVDISAKQAEFFSAVERTDLRYLLFGGAMGGAKSYSAIMKVVSYCCDYPNSRWAVVRKNLTTIKRTAIKTFEKIADNLGLEYELNRNELIVRIGTSELSFIEADESKDPDLNKLRGLELTGALVEECNEVTEKVFNILITRIGRWNENGCPAKLLLTCNPSQNWVKSKFYDNFTAGTLEPPFYFIQALPTDNPFLSKEYLASLEDLPEAEYKRFVKGDWNFSDDPNQLIPFEWIKRAYEVEENLDGTKILAVDVARFGKDKTVFAFKQGNSVYRIEDFTHNSTIDTSELIMLRAREENILAADIIIDSVGLGAGVVDHLHSKGFRVQSFNGGDSPNTKLDHFSFKNKRAESYWNLRSALEKTELSLPDNERLKKDILSIRYFIKEKNIQIQSKDEIKRDLGFSPDYADAVSMLFGFKPKRKQIEFGIF